MYAGARVTDAVGFFRRKGTPKGAVREVRNREPERFRWRTAVNALTFDAGKLDGFDRMRIEEPIREVVLDLGNPMLRREVILDARRNRVDLDRGEVLPFRTVSDVRRTAFLTAIEIGLLERYHPLAIDFHAPVDTAAVTLIGRAYSDHFRRRAQQSFLSLPDGSRRTPQQHAVAERARRDAEEAEKWSAFARSILG